jgi:hypothetical protein
MKRIRVWVTVPDERFRAYEDEAKRRGVTVESLVEQTVEVLLREEEEEIREGTDHPIIIS